MRVRKAILLIIVSTLAACAQTPATDVAAGGAFDPARLARIGTAIEADIEAGKIPGAVALIVHGDDVVYHRSFGYADIASRTPMRNDAIFRIASMSKAVTTVGVMILYERGHFMLSDPVSKFLPEFADVEVIEAMSGDSIAETRPASNEIRIIDLLTHTSGISYPFIRSAVQQEYVDAGVIDGVTAADVSLATVMQRLAEVPLLFDPGTDYAYGLSTDVLGYLIEVVSGMPLDRFFAEEIFAPLGMDDTYFYLPAEKAARLVTLYADVDGLRVADGQESDIKIDNPRYPVEGARRYFSGGAGLSSTAMDYGRFLRMLLNDGELDGVKLLSRKSVELMRAPRIDRDGDGTAELALGFRVITDLGGESELGTPGLYSWGGAFYTSYWIDPQEKLVGVLMSQLIPATTDLAGRYRNLVYQALR